MRKFVAISFLLILVLACGSGGDTVSNQVHSAQADPQTLYKNHCSICHGDDGKLGFSGAKDLSQTLFSLEEIVGILKYGSKNGKMRAFGKEAGGELTNKEIKTIAEYVAGFKIEKENE